MITNSGLTYLGIEATADLTGYIPQLQAIGLGFAIRYYAPEDTTTATAISLTEAQALSAAGINIVAVWYAAGATAASYFTPEQGYADGYAAFTCAQCLGQPLNSTIYFTVDYAPTTADVTDIIIPYLNAAQAALSTNGIPNYNAGVQGNDLICYMLQQQATTYNLWQSNAAVMVGGTPQNYDIMQSGLQLICPADTQRSLSPLTCTVNTSANIPASSFTI